jgi:uncharacterized protein (DUF927 family)
MISQEIVPVAEVLSRSELVCRHFAGKGLIPVNGVSTMNAYFRAAASLPLERYRLVNRHGWQPGEYCFMHGTYPIIPARRTDLKGMLPSATYSMVSAIGVMGTLEEWQKNVLFHATGIMQKLAVLIGLSSPLLAMLNKTGAIFHFFGFSGVGKTALLQLAASVNGNGSEPGCGYDSLIESWNMTANAAEMLLEQRNHTTALFDELGVYKSPRIGDAIYSVAGGKGKHRMSGETLKNVDPAKWLLNIISSGEISMQERLGEGGEEVRAGMLHRCIDLLVTQEMVCADADETENDRRHRVDAIKNNAGKYYGVAGRTFVEKLVNLTDDNGLPVEEHVILDYINDLYDHVYGLLVSRCGIVEHEAGSVKIRALERFSVCGTAGFLAVEFGILDWSEDDIIDTLSMSFADWLAELQVENDPILNALLCLQNNMNIEHQTMGNVSKNLHVLHPNMVTGYRLPDKQTLVLLETIDRWMKPLGFNAKKIAKALETRGFLKRTEKDRFTSRRQIGNKVLNGLIIDDTFLTAELS